MKKLETEFVMNADKRGNNKFVQIKRNDKAALYQRFKMDGQPQEYEVFEIKIRGGNVFGRHYEPYEGYPGASSFGRYAWTTLSREAAEHIFDLITKGSSPLKENQKIVSTARANKLGRGKANRPTVVFPKKVWTMKEIAKLNAGGWTKPALYIEVVRLVKAGEVKEVKRVSMGRGRPAVFYKRV